jgi:SAM-dependent methyltransferase
MTTMPKLKNFLRMAAGPVRERGLRETLRSIRSVWHERRRARARPFDATFGTDTVRTVTVADLGATGADVPALWRYWPVSRDCFHAVMRDVDVPFDRTVFVDLGSGKGRALLLAAEYAFPRIIGVELSPSLHEIAGDNVQRFQQATRSTAVFELVCMDARDWQPPATETLIYLFQPFPADVMRSVLAHLVAGLGAEPARTIHLAYLHPLHHGLIMESGAFEVVRTGRAVHKGEFDWAIYRSSAPALR